MVQINEKLLDEKLTQLETARSWSPRVISKLETMIRTSEDFDLFRINPIQYATDRGMTENESIDLFLYATSFGLFELEWHLICACCGRVVESLRHMDSLHGDFNCYVCGLDNEVALDDYIQVTFTISPQIRDIAYRHPESLSIEDYYYKHQVVKGVKLPPGAPTYEEYLRYSTRLLSYLDPQEKKRIEFDCPSGFIFGVDPINTTSFALTITDDPSPEPQPLVMQVTDGKFQPVNRDLTPREFDMLDGIHVYEQHGEFASGQIHFEVENLTDSRGAIWLIHFPPELNQKPPLEFEPFLSGKRLLTTQTFRDLFRSEVVQSSEGIDVQDITFLFTDLKGSTEMYDTIGDAKAYFLVRQHFETLGNVIVQNSGAIVKTIGDAVMATFVTPADAVKATVDMLRDIETFNRNISQELILKIGIHRGHSIVVTLNERLDYFGQTVNIAARVQALADAGEIYVTDYAYDEQDLAAILDGCKVTSGEASLKGVRGKLQVHKITL